MNSIMEKLMGIIAALSGWKMLLGYVILNLPLFSSDPALTEAINKVTSDPSPANIANFLGHVILLVGSIDRLRKNVSKSNKSSNR